MGSKGLNLTKELNIVFQRNNYAAWKHFGYNWNDHKGLVLHHKDETLRHNDIERYILWLPEDLEVMTIKEHNQLHHKGKTTEFKIRSRKKVKCIDTGVVYESILAASIATGIDSSTVSRCCRGVRKQVNGLHFEYLQEV